jgi:DnaK suppressor protein
VTFDRIYSRLAKLADRGKAEIVAIDRALARIENDQYGECSECGGHIPPERHDALPETDICIQCAQRRESARV